MIARLVLKNKDKDIYVIDINGNNSKSIEPITIWGEINWKIKQIKNLNHDLHSDNINIKSIYNSLLQYDNYEFVNLLPNPKANLDNLEYYLHHNPIIKYYMYLYIDESIISFKAYLDGDKEVGTLCYTQRHILSNDNEGNCIDDFIKRGVNPQLKNINDLIDSIISRLPEREIATEYHTTGCYEKDFLQISLIKKCARKIVENCDKHLERIAEFYTR